jgi:hypothetical protein
MGGYKMGKLSDAFIEPFLFSKAETVTIISPNARRSDPDTSHAAADRHPALRHNDRHAALLAHYEHQAGLTDFELADIMGRQQTSAGKRRGELRDLGFIEDSGLRRDAPSGSPSIVWRITALGRMACQ